MELNQLPLPQSIPRPAIQGDPATRRFAEYLIGTLAIVTIGSIIGITAGNFAHYEYFAPSNLTSISSTTLYNASIIQKRSIEETSRLWLPLQKRLKRSNSSRKTRHTWLLIEKPANNRRW